MKFRNISRSTFDHIKFCTPPEFAILFAILTLRYCGFSLFWPFAVVAFRYSDPSLLWPFAILDVHYSGIPPEFWPFALRYSDPAGSFTILAFRFFGRSFFWPFVILTLRYSALSLPASQTRSIVTNEMMERLSKYNRPHVLELDLYLFSPEFIIPFGILTLRCCSLSQFWRFVFGPFASLAFRYFHYLVLSSFDILAVRYFDPSLFWPFAIGIYLHQICLVFFSSIRYCGLSLFWPFTVVHFCYSDQSLFSPITILAVRFSSRSLFWPFAVVTFRYSGHLLCWHFALLAVSDPLLL